LNMRNFTKKQKLAVELVTGRSGDGDHVQPHARGGRTTVENCQLLSTPMNQRKGSFEFRPRKWQSKFFERWNSRSQGDSFMLIAIPGSGKTFAALEAARKWMQAGPDRRLIVVVPTDNLRSQWQTEAVNFGIDLQSKEFGAEFKDGYQGGVATYHLVANNSLVFRKLCAVAPTMVIFDEIHHCGEESHFGKGIQEGFELARERLLMSGTPWKSNGQTIPFVRYDSCGFAVGDYRYDYPDALTDSVVRYLVFDYAKGSITNGITNERSEISENISDDEASKRLRPLLDPDGDYIEKQLSEAHRKLMDCRRSVPDAAGLAICIDQFHAVKVARLIEKVTGKKPSIIVSDSDVENDSVENFRKSRDEWLVAVKKVSEGTDIKRLQVLCYLTNVTSELFFRQVIGRVSRVRELEDYEGYIYLPADPRLIAAARNIENAQVVAAKEDAKKIGQNERGEATTAEFAIWETEHNGTETVLVAGERVPIDYYRRLETWAEHTQLPITKVRELATLMAIPAMTASENAHQPEPEQETREAKEKRLRRSCSKLAFRYARIIDVEVQEIHGRFPPQKNMNLDQLKNKERKIASWIRKA